MVNLKRDIHSLTDFKRDTGRFVKQAKQTGGPIVLTVNGRAELVVQDADAFQKLLDRIEELETIAGVKEAMAAKERGEGVPMREVIERLAAKHNVELDG